MLFKARILDGIARAEIDLAFRRWSSPAVKEGTLLRTSVGAIVIGKVTPIEIDGLTAEEAKRAGFKDVTALVNDLRTGEERTVFRIELAGVEPDDRIGRQNQELTKAEAADLVALLARWDKNAPTAHYYMRILRLICERPGIAAIDLATSLGVEKLKFKRDVRKLKELGLTISLDIGYRLSPKGERVLEEIR
ncbi:ASCH domain-containing protein [Phyllobacterium sp. SB3]|uniref:ASCH domain-containing protein n=1 Tax=Phyllobacterium sp. SB3 TaxID=3156073 RepID=UPI0032AECB5E